MTATTLDLTTFRLTNPGLPARVWTNRMGSVERSLPVNETWPRRQRTRSLRNGEEQQRGNRWIPTRYSRTY